VCADHFLESRYRGDGGGGEQVWFWTCIRSTVLYSIYKAAAQGCSRGFPGGECSFALTDYDSKNPGNIILFTGGNHTGHFYAVGEVLFSKKNPEKPLAYLPRPVLAANPKFPYEHGFSAEAPFEPVSSFADCIFFNGLTKYKGKWWFYYGGSEYYTCLATSIDKE